MQDNEKSGGLLERRSFVRGGVLGLGTVGAALVGAKLGVFDKASGARRLGLSSAAVEAWSTITDTDILNFALNLEYLEAEFYTVAVTGKTLEQSGIPTTGTGNSGPTTGGQQVNFVKSPDNTEITGQLNPLAQELMLTEQEHVMLLRKALGSDAIAKPAINLNALGTGFEGFLHLPPSLAPSKMLEFPRTVVPHHSSLVKPSSVLPHRSHWSRLITRVLFA